MLDNLGYCCINNTLRSQGIFTSRSLIKRTFTIEKASKLALQNCKDLLTILKWNSDNNINVFRISSELFPRYTCREHGYTFTDLDDHIEISDILADCGEYAIETNQHLSFHPSPYTTLASPNEVSAMNGVREVEYHTLLCDLIDPNDIMDIPINFHVGGSYKQTYKETAQRFIDRYNMLSDSSKKRVCLENDDKCNSGWAVDDLYNHIHLKTGIPICFDIHHWKFRHSEDRTMYDDYKLARSTWKNRSMQVHYSESKNPNKLITAHSDYYSERLPDFIDITDPNIHIHLECKQKDVALLQYRKFLQK